MIDEFAPSNKNNMPKISIITVVLNRVKYIEQALLSVINQTYPNVEYIVIDGGSTDGTLDIIKKYLSEIDCFVSEPDKGMYFALNKGIEKATGELIGIVHSDDYYYDHNVVENIVIEHLKVNADIYHGNVEYLIETKEGFRKEIGISNADLILKTGTSILHPTTFIKKSVLNKYGIYDTRYHSASDYELMIRLKKNHCYFYFTGIIISNVRILNKGRVSNNCYAHIEAYKMHKFHKTGNHNQYIFSFIHCLARRTVKKILLKI